MSRLMEIAPVVDSIDQPDAAVSTDAPSTVTPADQKVADTAMNGAQVTALVDVVSQVAAGMIPRESAIRIIEKAFMISTEEANKILGKAGAGFVQPQSGVNV